MKRSKRFLSAVLVLCMVLSMLPSLGMTASAAAGDTYELVTDASTLQAGDTVIIVAAGYDYALSTTQNENNRGQAAVTKASDNTLTFSSNVQELTLEAGTITNTFAFYTGAGYLYAASSSSNHLKTQTTLNDNGSWTITIGNEGVATIQAQGTNKNNQLQYNLSSKLFSCYGSAQKEICIYKKHRLLLPRPPRFPIVKTVLSPRPIDIPQENLSPFRRLQQRSVGILSWAGAKRKLHPR